MLKDMIFLGLKVEKYEGSLHLIIMQKDYSNQNSNRYFPLFNTT